MQGIAHAVSSSHCRPGRWFRELAQKIPFSFFLDVPPQQHPVSRGKQSLLAIYFVKDKRASGWKQQPARRMAEAIWKIEPPFQKPTALEAVREFVSLEHTDAIARQPGSYASAIAYNGPPLIAPARGLKGLE